MSTITNVATKQELVMFERGYASVRLVVKKTHYSRAHIAKLIRDGEIEGMKVGRCVYADMTSVGHYLGVESSEILGLEDWGDVLGK